MVDERTRRALRDLAEKQRAAVGAAEEVCQCANCAQARLKNEISQCDKDKLLQSLPEMIVKPNPSNFFPELSPNYESHRLGRVNIYPARSGDYVAHPSNTDSQGNLSKTRHVGVRRT
jgi:hypothetical protein